MKTRILKNGLKLIHLPRSGGVVCIEINVKVGSNNEQPKTAGISHFIEHMLFEGTAKRPDSFAISNEIEKIGGELNAATSNERTFFYAKVPTKHFDTTLEVLSDIIQNPAFKEEHIAKEKDIIVDEIHMVNDQPRYFQWVFFESSLYKAHPAKNPIYGNEEAVRAFTREDIQDYYNAHYRPNNMTIAVVGGPGDALNRLQTAFEGMLPNPVPDQAKVDEPELKSSETIEKVMENLQAYTVLGYKTVPRSHPDSYILDVIRAILGRGQSGKIFDEIRNKRGLAYDVGVHHNPSTDFGFFSIYVTTAKKNIDAVKEIILTEIEKLKQVSQHDIDEAKTFLEGEYLLNEDDSQKFADIVAFWDQVDSDVSEYVEKIKAVKRDDIIRVLEKYMKHHVMAVLK